VHQEITHHFRGLKQQAAIQTDGAACRAAAPACALTADCNASIRKAQGARAFGQRRNQKRVRTLTEPSAQGMPHEACIARIADEAYDPWRNRASVQRACAAGNMYTPALPKRGELNRLRRKALWSGSAAPRMGKLGLDPFAMSGEELRYRVPRGAPRDHDFYPPGVEYAHRKAACAATFAHRPARCGSIVRP
jgi:hypothetical protein